MDANEAHAMRFLEELGLGPVIYEPDGNHPPDFVTVDGTAVEVRRLNQHLVTGVTAVPLEADAFPIMRGFERLLASYGPSAGRDSWWVRYRFRRPVMLWKVLEPHVRDLLDEIDRRPGLVLDKWPVANHFEILTHPCSGPQPRRFMFSGYSDFNAGGWLIHELHQNARICIEEKTRKIAPVRSRYARWWLVLVDQIGLGSGLLGADLLAEQIRIEHNWDRVIVLSPTDPTQWHEVLRPD